MAGSSSSVTASDLARDLRKLAPLAEGLDGSSYSKLALPTPNGSLVCLLCNGAYVLPVSETTKTSNFVSHVAHKHPFLLSAVHRASRSYGPQFTKFVDDTVKAALASASSKPAATPKLTAFFSAAAPAPSEKRACTTPQLVVGAVIMLAMDTMPLSAIEGAGLRGFLRSEFGIKTKLPARRQVTKAMNEVVFPAARNVVNARLRSLVEGSTPETIGCIGVESDYWRAGNGGEHLGLIVRGISPARRTVESIPVGCTLTRGAHTASNIASHILDIFAIGGFTDQELLKQLVAAHATDTAANALAATRELGWEAERCKGHRTNLLLGDMFRKRRGGGTSVAPTEAEATDAGEAGVAIDSQLSPAIASIERSDFGVLYHHCCELAKIFKRTAGASRFLYNTQMLDIRAETAARRVAGSSGAARDAADSAAASSSAVASDSARGDSSATAATSGAGKRKRAQGAQAHKGTAAQRNPLRPVLHSETRWETRAQVLSRTLTLWPYYRRATRGDLGFSLAQWSELKAHVTPIDEAMENGTLQAVVQLLNTIVGIMQSCCGATQLSAGPWFAGLESMHAALAPAESDTPLVVSVKAHATESLARRFIQDMGAGPLLAAVYLDPRYSHMLTEPEQAIAVENEVLRQVTLAQKRGAASAAPALPLPSAARPRFAASSLFAAAGAGAASSAASAPAAPTLEQVRSELQALCTLVPRFRPDAPDSVVLGFWLDEGFDLRAEDEFSRTDLLDLLDDGDDDVMGEIASTSVAGAPSSGAEAEVRPASASGAVTGARAGAGAASPPITTCSSAASSRLPRNAFTIGQAAGVNFRLLRIAFRRLHCRPQTSCNAERLFSAAGRVFSKLRQGLTGDNGEKLVLLGQWLKLPWFKAELDKEIVRLQSTSGTGSRGAGAGAGAASARS